MHNLKVCKFSHVCCNSYNSPPKVGPKYKEGASLCSCFSDIISLFNFGASKKNYLKLVFARLKYKQICWDDSILKKHVDVNNMNLLKNEITGEDSEVVNVDEKYFPAKLIDDSCFISLELNGFFESCLPKLLQGCKKVLLYSTLKHGISLRTMIRKTAKLNTPVLLVAGDMQGAVFGALLDCPLIPTTKPKYQGTHQTFVFTNIYGHPRIFRPTGVNRYYYLCSNDSLALGGGGGFALRLDGDLLTGTSGPCETFGNRCLAHSPEFELKNVELWGFTHA
ncbi:uncharacterized protein LOC131600203 isoform X2 [Vicia villosa]|uniref:uncharacterized protein LOC131600203 isoform X2 n=1 Tax=Vicia villosa TaxID=3911 RepID=UPI00273BE8D0|nr:uncharacterized protein LOC131600203 isoform X2 [Vicia villosa]